MEHFEVKVVADNLQHVVGAPYLVHAETHKDHEAKGHDQSKKHSILSA
jgi:hypothetical protein